MAERQVIADQIADLANTCGGGLANQCFGHGHYEEVVQFDAQAWTKFVTELSKIIENING